MIFIIIGLIIYFITITITGYVYTFTFMNRTLKRFLCKYDDTLRMIPEFVTNMHDFFEKYSAGFLQKKELYFANGIEVPLMAVFPQCVVVFHFLDGRGSLVGRSGYEAKKFAHESFQEAHDNWAKNSFVLQGRFKDINDAIDPSVKELDHCFNGMCELVKDFGFKRDDIIDVFCLLDNKIKIPKETDNMISELTSKHFFVGSSAEAKKVLETEIAKRSNVIDMDSAVSMVKALGGAEDHEEAFLY